MKLTEIPVSPIPSYQNKKRKTKNPKTKNVIMLEELISHKLSGVSAPYRVDNQQELLSSFYLECCHETQMVLKNICLMNESMTYES